MFAFLALLSEAQKYVGGALYENDQDTVCEKDEHNQHNCDLKDSDEKCELHNKPQEGEDKNTSKQAVKSELSSLYVKSVSTDKVKPKSETESDVKPKLLSKTEIGERYCTKREVNLDLNYQEYLKRTTRNKCPFQPTVLNSKEYNNLTARNTYPVHSTEVKTENLGLNLLKYNNEDNREGRHSTTSEIKYVNLGSPDCISYNHPLLTDQFQCQPQSNPWPRRASDSLSFSSSSGFGQSVGCFGTSEEASSVFSSPLFSDDSDDDNLSVISGKVSNLSRRSSCASSIDIKLHPVRNLQTACVSSGSSTCSKNSSRRGSCTSSIDINLQPFRNQPKESASSACSSESSSRRGSSSVISEIYTTVKPDVIKCPVTSVTKTQIPELILEKSAQESLDICIVSPDDGKINQKLETTTVLTQNNSTKTSRKEKAAGCQCVHSLRRKKQNKFNKSCPDSPQHLNSKTTAVSSQVNVVVSDEELVDISSVQCSSCSNDFTIDYDNCCDDDDVTRRFEDSHTNDLFSKLSKLSVNRKKLVELNFSLIQFKTFSE